jgi:hypothetical protein
MEVWFNASCSTCQSVPEHLGAGVDCTLCRYLEDAPSDAELREALTVLGFEPWDICAIGTMRWLTHRMVDPLPEPDREIDPDEPVPDDAAELLPDAPHPLPPAPIEATPDDPGGDPGGVPEPA